MTYQFNGDTLELLTADFQAGLSFWDSVDPELPTDDSLSFRGVGQGVGCQPFHSSFSSTRPDTMGNIPEQRHEILGEHATNSFGEWKEFSSHLPIQGESQGTTSTQSVDVDSESIMDYTNEFTTSEIFESKEALTQWIREVGRKNGFVIVVKRSDSGYGGQKARITFCCERGGEHRSRGKNKEDDNDKELSNISTKKCGCPFMLRANQLGSDDNWVLKVVCGEHNHSVTEPFKGRSYAGRLSKEETSLLINMSKNMVRPKDILVKLKNRDVNNASTIKQIYNARQRCLVPICNKQKVMLGYTPVAQRIEETDDDTDLHFQMKLTEHFQMKLTDIVNLQSTSLMEPETKKEIYGRPNSKGDTCTQSDPSTSEFATVVSTRPTAHGKEKVYRNMWLNSFPVGLRPYIHDIKDVAADGNCGFRAIADLMGFGENEWKQVRMDLLNQMNSNLERYSLLYRTDGTDSRVQELIRALSYFESNPPFDGWMTMPDMGHIIASAYNVVLFHLSFRQCLTFLPLKSLPMPQDSRKHIAIGFVNDNHFVEVFLTPDHPVPPIADNWYKFREDYAEGWGTAYSSRIQHFKKIIGNDVATKEILDID